MTEKRFTTVELPSPNRWGIWYDGAYLSTYQVCTLLNEYVDVKKENERLKAQLCKEDDVCGICKHQYLTKTTTDEYYIAKCEKRYEECSKGTVRYCEDFECKKG